MENLQTDVRPDAGIAGEIVDAYLSGLSYAECSRRFGVTDHRVRSALRQAGVKPRPQCLHAPSQVERLERGLPSLEQLAEDYRSGGSVASIAEFYGVSRHMVTTRLKRVLGDKFPLKRRYPHETRAAAFAAFRAGSTVRDVSERFGVVPKTAEKWQWLAWRDVTA